MLLIENARKGKEIFKRKSNQNHPDKNFANAIVIKRRINAWFTPQFGVNTAIPFCRRYFLSGIVFEVNIYQKTDTGALTLLGFDWTSWTSNKLRKKCLICTIMNWNFTHENLFLEHAVELINWRLNRNYLLYRNFNRFFCVFYLIIWDRRLPYKLNTKIWFKRSWEYTRLKSCEFQLVYRSLYGWMFGKFDWIKVIQSQIKYLWQYSLTQSQSDKITCSNTSNAVWISENYWNWRSIQFTIDGGCVARVDLDLDLSPTDFWSLQEQLAWM